MKVCDIDLINDIDILVKKKIIFYGAGEYGKRALDLSKAINGINIYCFCETDVDKWKKKSSSETYGGYEVKNLETINSELKSEEYIIIISTKYILNEELIKEIENKVPENVFVCTWFGFRNCIELNIMNECVKQEYREQFLLIRQCKRKMDADLFIRSNLIKLNQKNPIMVYQPGKVGSSTINKSLQNYGLDYVQMHMLAFYDDYFDIYRSKESIDLQNWWIKNKATTQNVKVISLVRDPIARSVSAYFQTFREDYIMLDSMDKNIYKGAIDRIRHDMSFGDSCGYIFDWFNKELKEVFGVDVYKYPFDKEKGYAIIKKDNVEILLMTMEKMNQNEKVVGDFVGVIDFKYTMDNVGAKKEYKYAYKEFLENAVIEEDILDYYYRDNEYMDHFYTAEQKDIFRKRWNGKE